MNNEIKSVILAAGKGTRMKSNTSKVLHKIFGKPILGYVLDNSKNIVSESFVIVGHHAEEVTEFVEKNYVKAKTILQSPQLGTGHAVSMACPYLENFDGQVIILNGDLPLMTEESIRKFIEYHNSKNSDLTIMSTILDDPANYGRIIREKDDSLKCIVEAKDATPEEISVKEINVGVYLLNWSKIKPAFSQLTTNNAQGEYYLTDIIGWGKKNNLNVHAYILENSDESYGINSRKDLAYATKVMNERKLDLLMDNGGADTIIYPSTYIEGKNKIGKNCKIGPCAHLRGEVEIDDNCKIGNFVEVKKAKIGHNTNAGHLSYIGDSELGSHINIGAGTITANYDPISKTKSKTILKDNVKIGSNTVLVAPVEIGEGTNIGAGSVITKNIGEWALGLTRAPLRIIENWVKH